MPRFDMLRRHLLPLDSSVIHAHRWDEVCAVAFSPNGIIIASGSRGRIRLHDTASGELLRELYSVFWATVNCVVFSPDGRRIASADDVVRVWDTNSGSLLHALDGHIATVTSVAFSPDGKLLVSGSRDGTIKLWDATRRTLLKTVMVHSGHVQSVAISPSGTRKAAMSTWGKVTRWDAALDKVLLTRGTMFSETFGAFAFSPDGSILAWADGSMVELCGVASNCALLKALKGMDPGVLPVGIGNFMVQLRGLKCADFVRSIAFSADGNIIACGLHNGSIELWNILYYCSGHLYRYSNQLILSQLWRNIGLLGTL